MSESDLAELDRDALIALILKLQAEIEALKRSGKRQAAPFSRGTRKGDPKRSGRKPGQGTFKTREAPTPEQLSEPPIDVPAAEAECPKCGGELDEGRVEEASITDLPEVVKPRVRLFRVGVRGCKRCGTTVRGRHPDLAADQRGATAHRLGPRLRAAAHQLHYGVGVPVRRLPAVLEMLTGVGRLAGGDHRRRLEAGRRRDRVDVSKSVRFGPRRPLRPHRRHRLASGGFAGMADGLRDQRGDGLPGPAAAPQRGGPRANPRRLPRRDDHRPGRGLRRRGLRDGPKAEVSGARAAIVVGGAGDEVARRSGGSRNR